MKSRCDWIKGWVRIWAECNFCHRNIYTGERVWRLTHLPNYVICKECGNKHKLKEEVMRDVVGK